MENRRSGRQDRMMVDYSDGVADTLKAIKQAEDVLQTCQGVRELVMESMRRNFGPIARIRDFID